MFMRSLVTIAVFVSLFTSYAGASVARGVLEDAVSAVDDTVNGVKADDLKFNGVINLGPITIKADEYIPSLPLL
ncbi:hypothetical protein AMATHDRAFT_6918 [Amanita thiersii Skay4041]|uniref:Uncharacterized protein n=1 Tax=Amanita thiersii Skay4041 TaxID=703135 RepID=A0A2A9NHV0_9AGAR|nr:hypothetical protein AMATHDRAFT_6918 [Amanita thiersii Skay4041]